VSSKSGKGKVKKGHTESPLGVVGVTEHLSGFVTELNDLLEEGSVLNRLVLVRKDDPLAGLRVRGVGNDGDVIGRLVSDLELAVLLFREPSDNVFRNAGEFSASEEEETLLLVAGFGEVNFEVHDALLELWGERGRAVSAHC